MATSTGVVISLVTGDFVSAFVDPIVPSGSTFAAASAPGSADVAHTFAFTTAAAGASHLLLPLLLLMFLPTTTSAVNNTNHPVSSDGYL